MTGTLLAKKIITRCIQKKITLCGAESCTGGLVSSILTKIPGCSQVFKGSIVSYANAAKIALLGVPETILEHYGAVSEHCAEAMALGAAEKFNADIAFAVTGIAGPEGGSSAKPVGTVWFSLYVQHHILTQGIPRKKTWKCQFTGSRLAIQKQSALELLQVLLIIISDE
ncbi:MAG TPA: CinA family protein [Spirochaetia bacterium]|nr:CinA family protein [Spirochaetia bacterium]